MMHAVGDCTGNGLFGRSGSRKSQAQSMYGISMNNIIRLSSGLLYIALAYKWLKDKKFDENVYVH